MDIKYGYSKAKYAGNGVTTDFAVPFPYLNKFDVQFGVFVTATHANVGGSYTLSWVNANTIKMTPAIAVGHELWLERNSSVRGRLVDFADGTGLTERDLDTGFLQAWYTSQEALDEAGLRMIAATTIDLAVSSAQAAATAAAGSAAAAASSLAGIGSEVADATAQAVAAAASAASAAVSAASAAGAAATAVNGKMDKASNLSDVASVPSARTNLGLGSMALENTSAYLTAVAIAAGYASRTANLSDLASASTARTNLGLGSMAVESTATYLTGAAIAATYATLAGLSSGLALKASLAGATFSGLVTFNSNTLWANGASISFNNSTGVASNVLTKYTDNKVYLDSVDGDLVIRGFGGAVIGNWNTTALTATLSATLASVLSRGGAPEKNFARGAMNLADPFLSLKDGTIASFSTASTYRKPIVYLERWADNPSLELGAEECDWSNGRMRPAMLVEMIAGRNEAGAPTCFTGRAYTDAPTAGLRWSITGITRSGAVATATTSVAHGRTSGDILVITGAGQPEYNGSVTITVINATQFTYAVAGTPTTPATGTINAYAPITDGNQFLMGGAWMAQSNAGTFNANSVVDAGTLVTVTTANSPGGSAVPHPYLTNDRVEISGATPAGYNGQWSITKIGPNTFTFVVPVALGAPGGTWVIRGVNRDVFGANIIASFLTGSKPGNVVGLEVDIIPGQSANTPRPGTGNYNNFTAIWAQSAGSGGVIANTGLYVSHAPGSGGWRHGIVVDTIATEYMARFVNQDSSTGNGVRIEGVNINAGARLLECWVNGVEAFRVDGDTGSNVWIRVYRPDLGTSVLRQIEVGAPDSGGTSYRMLRVLN